jgi:ABC-type transporter lipoprotein component MlaA
LEKKMYTSNIIPRNVYLADSLIKQRDRALQERKVFVADSIQRYKTIRDSILKARGQKPMGKNVPKKTNNYLYSFLMPYENRKNIIRTN